MQSPSQDFDMAIMDSLIAENCTDLHSNSDAASAWWAQAAEKYSLTQVLIKQHHWISNHLVRHLVDTEGHGTHSHSKSHTAYV